MVSALYMFSVQLQKSFQNNARNMITGISSSMVLLLIMKKNEYIAMIQLGAKVVNFPIGGTENYWDGILAGPACSNVLASISEMEEKDIVTESRMFREEKFVF